MDTTKTVVGSAGPDHSGAVVRFRCGHDNRVVGSLFGRQARCPRCGRIEQISPDGAAAAAPPAEAGLELWAGEPVWPWVIIASYFAAAVAIVSTVIVVQVYNSRPEPAAWPDSGVPAAQVAPVFVPEWNGEAPPAPGEPAAPKAGDQVFDRLGKAALDKLLPSALGDGQPAPAPQAAAGGNAAEDVLGRIGQAAVERFGSGARPPAAGATRPGTTEGSRTRRPEGYLLIRDQQSRPAPDGVQPLDLISAGGPTVVIPGLRAFGEKANRFVADNGLKLPESLPDVRPSALLRDIVLGKLAGVGRGVDENAPMAAVLPLARGRFRRFDVAEIVWVVPYSDLNEIAGGLGIQAGELKPGKVAITADRAVFVWGRYLVIGPTEEVVAAVVQAGRAADGMTPAERARLERADVLVRLTAEDLETLQLSTSDANPQIRELVRLLLPQLEKLRTVDLALRFDAAGLDVNLTAAVSEPGPRPASPSAPSNLAGLPMVTPLVVLADSEAATLARSVRVFAQPVLEQLERSSGQIAGLKTAAQSFTENVGNWRLVVHRNTSADRDGAFGCVAVFESPHPELLVRHLREMGDAINAAAGQRGRGAAPPAPESGAFAAAGSAEGIPYHHAPAARWSGRAARPGYRRSWTPSRAPAQEDPTANSSVAQLIEELKDFNPNVRLRAALALARRPDASEAIPALQEAARGKDEGVRLAAEFALKQIRPAVEKPAQNAAEQPAARPAERPAVRPAEPAAVRATGRLDEADIELFPGFKPQLDPTLVPILGPDWNRIRVAVVGNSVVVLLGSKPDNLLAALACLRGEARGLADAAAVADSRRRLAGDRVSEMYFSINGLRDLIRGRPLEAKADTAALTALGVSHSDERLRLDLWMPNAEVIAAAEILNSARGVAAIGDAVGGKAAEATAAAGSAVARKVIGERAALAGVDSAFKFDGVPSGFLTGVTIVVVGTVVFFLWVLF